VERASIGAPSIVQARDGLYRQVLKNKRETNFDGEDFAA
jgi:hypothetical protein